MLCFDFAGCGQAHLQELVFAEIRPILLHLVGTLSGIQLVVSTEGGLERLLDALDPSLRQSPTRLTPAEPRAELSLAFCQQNPDLVSREALAAVLARRVRSLLLVESLMKSSSDSDSRLVGRPLLTTDPPAPLLCESKGKTDRN